MALTHPVHVAALLFVCDNDLVLLILCFHPLHLLFVIGELPLHYFKLLLLQRVKFLVVLFRLFEFNRFLAPVVDRSFKLNAFLFLFFELPRLPDGVLLPLLDCLVVRLL